MRPSDGFRPDSAAPPGDIIASAASSFRPKSPAGNANGVGTGTRGAAPVLGRRPNFARSGATHEMRRAGEWVTPQACRLAHPNPKLDCIASSCRSVSASHCSSWPAEGAPLPGRISMTRSWEARAAQAGRRAHQMRQRDRLRGQGRVWTSPRWRSPSASRDSGPEDRKDAAATTSSRASVTKTKQRPALARAPAISASSPGSSLETGRSTSCAKIGRDGVVCPPGAYGGPRQ